MKKILMISSLILLNVSVGFSKDIDFSYSDLDIEDLGLDQGGKIQLNTDIIIPANKSFFKMGKVFNPKGLDWSCSLSFPEKESVMRVIKKGTIFNVVQVQSEVDRYGNPLVKISFASNDAKKRMDSIDCNLENLTAKKFTKTFGGKFKILAPQPVDIQSEIKIPKNKKSSDSPKIEAAEVVQRLPQACVYIGMWKEKDQLPNLSQNARNYLDTLIPILRGTFKSLNNIDCESIPKEKLVEAAIKLSEDKNVNDNSRNTTKPKKGNNSKAKGHKSKNM